MTWDPGIVESAQRDTGSQAAHYHAARRILAARYHPDRGGDVDVFVQQLAALDRRYARAHPSAAQGVTVVHIGRLTRLHNLLRQLSRKWPATRRYIDL